MPRIAALVILYNSPPTIFNNINSYISQVEKVFAVDNSDKDSDSFLKYYQSNPRIEYIPNHSNLGISAALNIGLKRAIDSGFDFVLTMDQDSVASSEMVKILSEIMVPKEKIGIVAAEHINLDVREIPPKKITTEVLYTMTSGNLLNLAAYLVVGGFKEELFIDHVDHEYCLRLNSRGFKVIKTNKAIVYHKLGNTTKKKFFHLNLYPSNHPPIRLYYRTRNRFYVDRIYKKIFPEYVKEDIRHFIREVIEIFLYEKDLWKKSKMIFTGYRHYKKNILGRYQNAISK